MMTNRCCAECGEDGGVSLKICKACMLVRYCNADCQRNHWSTHKKQCRIRAAELHDEVLFKDPPPKEDCPICFLPMPVTILSCIPLPDATITSVPIYDFAVANAGLAVQRTEEFYSCCGKSICKGCIYSFCKSGNARKCPFCNSDRVIKTDEKEVEEIMKRVGANDPGAICELANDYNSGNIGLQQDDEKARELLRRAAELGSSHAHFCLGIEYYEGGDLKKAFFHYETAAIAGQEEARSFLGTMYERSGNIERAVKHWIIAASAGNYFAMHSLQQLSEKGIVSRESIDSALTAFNDSCAEMRSEARSMYIAFMTAIKNNAK